MTNTKKVANPVVDFISLAYHNLRHNWFHSPVYKNADDSDCFEIFTEGITEIIFKSDLRFMCVYGICSEIYSYMGDTKNFLLVRKDLLTGEYECEWITTGRVAHDRAYMKITNRTFMTFYEQLQKLVNRAWEERRKHQNLNFDLHRDFYWM